jgi:hypothetical protein
MHLHLFEHGVALKRRIRADRRRASGTGPESARSHHGGGQKDCTYFHRSNSIIDSNSHVVRNGTGLRRDSTAINEGRRRCVPGFANLQAVGSRDGTIKKI